MASKWKRKGQAQFIMLEKYVILSAAWRACSPNERAAYLELKWRFKGTNNGEIVLSLRELAAALHVGKTTAGKALADLEAKGFIVTVTRSGFNVKIRKAAEYRLTEYVCNVAGELPTKAFMRWRPESQTEKNTVRLQGRPVLEGGQFDSEIEGKAA